MEYELLLKKIYWLGLGTIILVIFGLIAYYIFCCKNGLVLLVVHQQQNCHQFDLADVENRVEERAVDEEGTHSSSVFLEIPRNNSGRRNSHESSRSSMKSSPRSGRRSSSPVRVLATIGSLEIQDQIWFWNWLNTYTFLLKVRL